MKIDPTLTRDLFERMRAAAEASRSSPALSVETAGPTASADGVGGAAPLESNVRMIAERALRGEFTDARQVRTEVVHEILTERWEGRVDAAGLESMLDELTPALVDDPEFSRQVDEMLVLAARGAGSS